MPTKRLHVLGGGPWQLPTVKRAMAMGHRVFVTDYFEDRPAYAIAQAHEVVDITDADATLAASRRHGIDGIVCDSTDTGVRTAAAVADALGLVGIGPAAARACTDKAELRRLTQAAGLPSPSVQLVTAVPGPEALRALADRAVIVKPTDSQSGKGVTRLQAGGDLARAVHHALENSRQGVAMIESVVEGTEYIVDAFVTEEGPQVLGIAAKTPYAENPTISRRILYLAGDAFAAARAILEPALASTLRAIALRSGIVHAEFIVQGREATVIDVAARGGGVMIYSHVLHAVSGVDPVAAVVSHALAEPVSIGPTRRHAACIDFLRAPVGRVAGVFGLSDALGMPDIVAAHLFIEAGDDVSSLAKKDDRAGFVIGVGADENAAIAAADRARAVLGVRLVGETQAQRFH